jgi:hypothetical protein
LKDRFPTDVADLSQTLHQIGGKRPTHQRRWQAYAVEELANRRSSEKALPSTQGCALMVVDEDRQYVQGHHVQGHRNAACNGLRARVRFRSG